jgi:hypothetical protein
LKCFFSICLTALLIACAPVSSQTAASDTGIHVTGRYIRVSDAGLDEAESNGAGGYTAKVENDSGVQTSVFVKLAEPLPEGIRLIVHLIPTSDSAPHGWFEEVLSEYGGRVVPYDVYFTNEGGVPVTVRGQMTITFAIPDGFTDPAVYYVSTEGAAEPMRAAVDFEGGTISFTTDHNSYYVIVDRGWRETDHEPGASPPTGEGRGAWGWIAWLVLSGGGLIVLVYGRKRRQN